MHRTPTRGQALALFALFLLVLLGAAAIGVDYANWLLIDRQLQNVSDHAALAGASQFSQDFSSSSCASGSGPTQCVNARTQAWASLRQDLGLDTTTLPDSTIATLAARNSPTAGDTIGDRFGDKVWVSTPPPASSEYTGVGGLYKSSYGIVFVRVNRPTRSFFASVFGISVRNRIGWATAGILPTDFALQVFCRNNIAPENGVCADGGTSIGIDGGGGITLARGDIGSSNSLQVTQQTGQGVITKAGNVFLVNGTCGSSSWNCPPATLGGISDGSGTAKNAFYIPPIPVTYYALPTGTGTSWNDTTQPNSNCSTASIASPCIPIPPTSNYSSNGIDWACSATSGSVNQCGTPVVTTTSGVSTVTCTSHGAATQDMRPNGDDAKAPSGGGSWTTQGGSGSTLFDKINESTIDPSGSISNPPAGPNSIAGTPSSFVYLKDGTTTVGTSTFYRATVSSPNGTPQSPGSVYVRWTLFGLKKSGGSEALADPGGTITVTAQLQEKVGGTWVNRGAPDQETVTGSVVEYQTKAVTDVTTIGNPNALGILFTVSNPTGASFGAGISWAEAWLDQAPVPPPPPTVPPGQYRSIVIPDNGCAVLDPTGYETGGLSQYQMPGIYYFRDSSGGQNPTISLGAGSVLIGDGVTLVFDSNWPNPTGTGGSSSAHGIQLGSTAALVLNTGISSTSDGTCPAGTATSIYNPSTPLPALAHNAVCAAWEIDPTNPANGASSWGGPCSTGCSLDRTSVYASSLNSSWRGVTFYFKPKTNGFTDSSKYSVLGRFAMGGNVAGIAYRGILYAPYDDVQMSGANGFDTVGMVLAWTAKFNGGSASITLDYPYTRIQAPPYLLEPSVQQ